MSQAAPTISVSISTYNAASFIGAQLESVLKQTVPPDEIVIVDDASRDDTLAVVERTLRGCRPRVVLEQNARNQGWVKTASRAVQLCTSQWVANADHDDVWDPRKLELQREAVRFRDRATICFHDAKIVDEDLRFHGRHTMSAAERRAARTERLFPQLVRFNVVQGAAMFFRRSEWDRLLADIPADTAFDAWVALLLSAVGDAIFVDEALLLYRQHGKNQLGAPAKNDVASVMRRARLVRASADVHLLRQAHKYREARQRLAKDGRAQQDDLRLLDEKVAHLEKRAHAGGMLGVGELVAELRAGNYGRYGRGAWSFARDLLFQLPQVDADRTPHSADDEVRR